MRFLSVCSGIEAASVAWAPLGWRAAALAEIDPFACAVLAARHGASRPLFMPDPEAAGIAVKDRRKRAAAIRAVKALPEGGAVPNFGNLEAWKDWPDAAFDVLVGGTPCQSFSVAGLRKGLDDPRGNLALVYLAVVDRYRPRWVVWENVPGVLSSNKGRDFGAFLGGLGELGYGWAYRILDAQFVRTRLLPGAVPQRRRRVFVVGYLGDWRPPAAVLFDAESLRGNPPPRRRAGQGVAQGIEFGPSGGGFADVNPTLDTRAKEGPIGNQLAGAVLSPRSFDPEAIQPVAHALRAEGFDASEDGTGRGTPLIPEVAWPLSAGMAASAHRMPQEQGGLIPIAFDCKGTEVQFTTDGTHPTLRSMGHADSHSNAGGHAAVAYAIQERAVADNPAAGPQSKGWQEAISYTLEARPAVQAVAFQDRFRGDDGRGYDRPPPIIEESTGALETVKPWHVAFDLRGSEGRAMPEGPHDTANIRAASGGSSRSYLASPWSVRRLTPIECERLQGFPDGYTDVAPQGRNQTPDGPRYKALGNSMAVNVMGWIGERIALVDSIVSARAKNDR